MKIYLAGKITGVKNYKEKFSKKEKELIEEGFTVMNPAVLSDGFEHHQYLHINKAMIDVCDGVYFMSCWEDSPGACIENVYAIKNRKIIVYETGNQIWKH